MLSTKMQCLKISWDVGGLGGGGAGGNGTDISLLHLVLGRPVGKKSMFFVGETTKYKFFFF